MCSPRPKARCIARPGLPRDASWSSSARPATSSCGAELPSASMTPSPTPARVSWRPVESLLEAARRAKLDTATLLEGLPFDEKSLQPLGWIEWSDFCTLAERIAAAIGGPEQMLLLAE